MALLNWRQKNRKTKTKQTSLPPQNPKPIKLPLFLNHANYNSLTCTFKKCEYPLKVNVRLICDFSFIMSLRSISFPVSNSIKGRTVLGWRWVGRKMQDGCLEEGTDSRELNWANGWRQQLQT